MKHFLVYGTDEAGNGPVGEPLFLMSFDSNDLPENYLNRCMFLRKHAFGRLNHNFTHSEEVTVDSLEMKLADLIKKAGNMEDLLAYAKEAEGI